MNKIIKFLQQGFDVFVKNKTRSFLTVFGISIGIAMVILVLSAGNGVKSVVMSEIASFGDNWINIEVKIPTAAKNSSENSTAIAQGVTIKTLTTKDKDAIVSLDSVKQAYAGITSQTIISNDIKKESATIFGVSSEYFLINQGKINKGFAYTEADDKKGAQVVVLGATIAETLFGNQNVINETVKLNGKGYRVVGVMEPLGATGFMDMDSIIYVPAATVQQKIMGVKHILWIVADLEDDVENSDYVADEIAAILRDRHNIDTPDKDDFAVTTLAESVEIVDTILLGITWLLIALSAISLAVGGVGIMNIMYVSVAERTFEIGLRKAVGATPQDIKNQFLSEAIVITSIGGIVGIVVGIFLSFMISFVATSTGIDWPFSVSILSIILSVTFSATVGVAFGYYPAKQAATLDAITALRRE